MKNEMKFLFIYIAVFKNIATQPLYSKQIDNFIMATAKVIKNCRKEHGRKNIQKKDQFC